MPADENWILFKYSTTNSMRYNKIGIGNFRTSLNKALNYAFISLPFTNANINIGTANYGLSLEKRIENIVKGLLAENIIIEIFSKNSDLVYKNYLKDFPDQTPYWEKDKCDAVKKSLETEKILSQVDLKGLNINWTLKKAPNISELNQMELHRSTRAPNPNHIIIRPLVMLLEAPWRHFNKLKTQYQTYRMNHKVKYPHENLIFLCPNFSLSNLNENSRLLELYLSYYQYWENSSNKRNNFIKLNKTIPEQLREFTQKSHEYPESILWLIDNWEQINNCINNIIDELMKDLLGYWVWIFGIVNQDSSKYFEKVYQNDWIDFNGTKLWNSATRSPHEKKWTNYKIRKRKSKPIIAGDDHPDLYWNNNTIDIASEWVYAIHDNL